MSGITLNSSWFVRFRNGAYGVTKHVCRVQCFSSTPSAAIILGCKIVGLHAGQGIVDAIPSRDAYRTEKG
jgi:hypothetical protein